MLFNKISFLSVLTISVTLLLPIYGMEQDNGSAPKKRCLIFPTFPVAKTVYHPLSLYGYALKAIIGPKNSTIFNIISDSELTEQEKITNLANLYAFVKDYAGLSPTDFVNGLYNDHVDRCPYLTPEQTSQIYQRGLVLNNNNLRRPYRTLITKSLAQFVDALNPLTVDNNTPLAIVNEKLKNKPQTTREDLEQLQGYLQRQPAMLQEYLQWRDAFNKAK